MVLPALGLSYKATSNPPCTKRCLTLDTVLLDSCSAWAMVRLELVLRRSPLLPLPRLPVLMSEASRRIRARVCTRAGLAPVLTSFLIVLRSCGVNLICGAVFILNSTTFHLLLGTELSWWCTEYCTNKVISGKPPHPPCHSERSEESGRWLFCLRSSGMCAREQKGYSTDSSSLKGALLRSE